MAYEKDWPCIFFGLKKSFRVLCVNPLGIRENSKCQAKCRFPERKLLTFVVPKWYRHSRRRSGGIPSVSHELQMGVSAFGALTCASRLTHHASISSKSVSISWPSSLRMTIRWHMRLWRITLPAPLLVLTNWPILGKSFLSDR